MYSILWSLPNDIHRQCEYHVGVSNTAFPLNAIHFNSNQRSNVITDNQIPQFVVCATGQGRNSNCLVDSKI